MLVEINLLPQKEPKKYSFIIGTVGVALAFILVASFFFYQISQTKNTIAQTERQITVTQKVEEKLQENNTQPVAAIDSVSKLKDAIAWAQTYPIQTVPVMDSLSALLPERGFIQSFSYTENGTITLTVQFDSQREAAYFLNNLLNSNWISNANLSSISASGVNGQTNVTSGGATFGSNEDSADSSTISVETNILPRYTGQFEITLNKQEVHKLGKKLEEGVTGS